MLALMAAVDCQEKLESLFGGIWDKTALLLQLEIAMLASARFLKKKYFAN